MNYISSKDAAEKWRVNIRVVQGYCKNGRIPGAAKFGITWLIPEDAKKPVDPRKARKKRPEDAPSEAFFFSVPISREAYDIDKNTASSLALADVAFRRGDPEPAKRIFLETPDGDATKLSAASLAAAAAISSGDYAFYREIQQFLKSRMLKAKTARDRAMLSLPETMTAVSLTLPSMTPDWLKKCDFSLFPPELRPYLLYLYALHLRNVKDYSSALAVSRTALLLCENSKSFTWLDVYLGVLCACAAYSLGRFDESRRFLSEALAVGIPCGFISPFADYLVGLGGTLEAALEQQYPASLKPVLELWSNSFKGWIDFHNTFTFENITTLLSPREYHVALLLAHGATYSQAAARMNLSASSIKSIASDIYASLCIKNRRELAKFVF